MDSLTQAALGALCGELLLSKRLGWKGAAWGALFGTLPDLDILAYYWQDSAEQLRWHRGISHSLLMIPVMGAIFGGLLYWIHKKSHVKYKECFWFVFVTWFTHVLIDSFNSYGTQIFEPFSDYRFSLNNIAIIDLFFLVPILFGLLLCTRFFRGYTRVRWMFGWLTAGWLCLYFAASIGMKIVAERHFMQQLNDWGVTPKNVMTAPTVSNIFLWRMVAKDDEKYYVSYWSLFDDEKREYTISEFEHGHELEKDYKEFEHYKTLKWFTNGWHKTYQVEGEPDSIYIASLMIGEMRVPHEKGTELRPAFIWKLTKEGDDAKMERAFKSGKERWRNIEDAVEPLYHRVNGREPNWMKGKWHWELEEAKIKKAEKAKKTSQKPAKKAQ